MGIITEYPLWFILFCFLLGGLYSFILYFKTRKEDLEPWIFRIMVIFRFIAVSVISFLLLSPLIKKTTETIDKPLIIVAQDNSESIASGKDSSYYKDRYPKVLQDFIKSLSKKYEVTTYSFGDRIRQSLTTDYSDKQTDISAVFDELKNRYYNRNVGAVIVATDGIFNKGSNPFYSAQKLPFSIYTIALGDTTFSKDVILKKVIYNRNSFVGDKFPVEIMIEANKCNGEQSEVLVKQQDEVLFRKQVTFAGEKSFQKVSLLLDAREKGMKRFKVIMSPLKNEASYINNQQDILIEISDIRQKILITYQSPHPDIAALREALENSAKFEVECIRINEFNQTPDKYDLVILYQLPSVNEFNDLSRFINSRVSLLFFVGTTSDLNAFNSLKTGLLINPGKSGFTETQPVPNESFSLFTIEKENRAVFMEFPPLVCPFGDFQYSPVSDILFYQKIGNVQTKMPQVMFFSNAGEKTCIITGENIWKWRLSDYLQKGNHDVFNELFNKIAQYLAIKEDKSFFRIKCPPRFVENESLEMEAEVYNESYEMINDPEVSITITDEQKKSYPFVFGKTDKYYYLNAGNFPVGIYKYQATVKVGNNLYQKNGEFIISAINLESLTTIADHNLLYRISKTHDGEMFYPQDLTRLIEIINNREDVKPISYLQKRYSDMTGNLWLFILITGLLTAEWFLRKRSGIY